MCRLGRRSLLKTSAIAAASFVRARVSRSLQTTALVHGFLFVCSFSYSVKKQHGSPPRSCKFKEGRDTSVATYTRSHKERIHEIWRTKKTQRTCSQNTPFVSDRRVCRRQGSVMSESSVLIIPGSTFTLSLSPPERTFDGGKRATSKSKQEKEAKAR